MSIWNFLDGVQMTSNVSYSIQQFLKSLGENLSIYAWNQSQSNSLQSSANSQAFKTCRPIKTFYMHVICCFLTIHLGIFHLNMQWKWNMKIKLFNFALKNIIFFSCCYIYGSNHFDFHNKKNKTIDSNIFCSQSTRCKKNI